MFYISIGGGIIISSNLPASSCSTSGVIRELESLGVIIALLL
jgi:hypothetical protein